MSAKNQLHTCSWNILRRKRTWAVLILWMLLVSTATSQNHEQQARRILDATGVEGGLIIHVGCNDGRLTAALGADEKYLVHGLDTEAAAVLKTRKHIQSLGIYGKVTVDRYDGRRLPYIDNLANLVVAEEPGSLESAEIMRVLCPRGVAYVKRNGTWHKRTKPWPQEIDDWTHYLYDSTNNAVSKDSKIGPLARMQWLGGPRWSRHHDHMSSLSSLVSSNGRLFYILDEGSTASILLPSKWFLIGRDAFNGCILWKRPIDKWHTQLWPLKSGPALLTRRLVAVEDTVYATLGIDAPLSALDAVTGRTIRTYDGTEATEEILVSDGVLFLVVNKNPNKTWHGYGSIRDIKRSVRDEEWSGDRKLVMAVRANDGEILWEKESFVSAGTLAVDNKHAYFHDGNKIVAINRSSGKGAWTSEPLPVWQKIHSWFVPSLVVYDGVVLWAGGENVIPHRGGKDTMYAISARTGKTLWSTPHAASGYQSAEDLLVAGGLVWTGATTSGGYDGIFRGYDPHTGQLKKEFPPDVEAYWFHHRCYRGKATEDYLLMSRTGIEYLDIEKESWTLHHWVRGACLTGILPSNGMIYAPPHDCACYPEAKVYGFAALAPKSASVRADRKALGTGRLERGPAYRKGLESQISNSKADDWPTYRHDATRNAYTKMKIPVKLDEKWNKPLGGKLSAVTIADGRLFVASVDDHTVHALDAHTGESLWSHQVGGRVDSPPTIWRGLCLFGSADGYVYCVGASDGKMVWRFLAAPVDQRHTCFGQVESVWPVHGNILVQDEAAYFVAGRSMFLDGGLHLYRLDPKTGRVLTHKHFDDRDPETGTNLQTRHQILQMPVALPDVLSSDGERLYMRSQVFDLEGNRLELGPHTGDLVLQATVQRGPQAHLFAPYGFLDDSWFHRSYWVYGRSFSGSHGGYYQAGRFAPYGRILTADEQNVYGYARESGYLRWTTTLEYQLFSTDKEPPELPVIPGRRSSNNSWISVDNSGSLNPTGKPLAVEAWVRAEKPNGVVVARGGPANGYSLFLKGGRPHFAVRAKDKLYDVAAGAKVGDSWTHLTGVLTANKDLEIYVNGKLSGEAKAGAFIAADPSQAMAIGADDNSAVAEYESPHCFKGLIDEVRIYHGAVSTDEISRHFDKPDDAASAKAELVLHFTFDNGKARDRSENKNNGTIQAVSATKGRFGNAMRFTGRSASTKRHFVDYHWTVTGPPVIARAMILADDTLFIAGPTDIVDEDEAVAKLNDQRMKHQLEIQDAAMQGKRGGLLMVLSARDGRVLSRQQLDSMPQWDSMAAAYERLYFSTTDGHVRCMAGRN